MNIKEINKNEIYYSSEKSIRLDSHIHLGNIYSSLKNSSNNKYVTINDAYKYITDSKLTHAIILYTNYENLDELNNLLQNKVVLYGLKWICHNSYKSKEDYYNELSSDIDRPLFRGVKLHNRRSDYYPTEQYSLKNLSNLLDILPDSSIVLPHFQNSHLNDVSSFLPIILKYTNLKFILGHAGYLGNNSFMPVINSYDEYQIKTDFLKHCYSSKLNLISSYELSKLPNVYLDGSIYIKGKEILLKTKKLMIGSDYNFFSKISYKEILYNYFRKEEQILVSDLQRGAVNFLNADIKEYTNNYISETDRFNFYKL